MADSTDTVGIWPLLDTIKSLDATLTSTAAGYFTRLYVGFYTISIISSVWVYFFASKLRPGLSRALACLPVVLLQLAATPLLVDRLRTPVLIVPVCGTFSLAAFKVRLLTCTQKGLSDCFNLTSNSKCSAKGVLFVATHGLSQSFNPHTLHYNSNASEPCGDSNAQSICICMSEYAAELH